MLQEGVTAVLAASTTDVLSHVAIRARSQGVLLATCFNAGELSHFKENAGKQVSLTVSASGSVAITASTETVDEFYFLLLYIKPLPLLVVVFMGSKAASHCTDQYFAHY